MRVGRVDSELAGIALLEGKPQAARELLPDAIAGLRTRAYKLPPLIAEARLLLACAQSPGPQCPRDLRARVEQHLGGIANRRDPHLLWAYTLLAQVELQEGEPARARVNLEHAIQQASAELPPAHPRRLAAELWLAVAEARAGDCSDATTQARAAQTIMDANGLGAHPELAGARAVLGKPVAGCGVVLR
jgi:serine/threonine-protein kinase